MKQTLLAFLLATVLCSTVSAKALQNLPYTLRTPGETWAINNITGTMQVTFTVYKNHSGTSIPSDPVTVYCDKIYTVMPGHTISCILRSWAQGKFFVNPSEFRYGAEGWYSIN